MPLHLSGFHLAHPARQAVNDIFARELAVCLEDTITNLGIIVLYDARCCKYRNVLRLTILLQMLAALPANTAYLVLQTLPIKYSTAHTALLVLRAYSCLLMHVSKSTCFTYVK